jgi:capsule polysaccharide export protein KpsC/LpsZ
MLSKMGEHNKIYIDENHSNKLKNVKCKTEQEQSEIQKSRNAIEFIMQIRKREK